MRQVTSQQPVNHPFRGNKSHVLIKHAQIVNSEFGFLTTEEEFDGLKKNQKHDFKNQTQLWIITEMFTHQWFSLEVKHTGYKAEKCPQIAGNCLNEPVTCN